MGCRDTKEQGMRSFGWVAAAFFGAVPIPATAAPDAAEDTKPKAQHTLNRLATSAPGVAAAAVRAATNPCPDATVTSQPVTGGRILIKIDDNCRAGRPFSVRYERYGFHGRLNGDGKAEVLFDLFLGAAPGVAVHFTDGKRQHVAMTATDLDMVTKLAVVWQAPVDLDLHAFEYAAAMNEPGHIWSGSPADAAQAWRKTVASGRGRGFITRLDGRSTNVDDPVLGPAHRAEVYTFWHAAERQSGTVATSLDFTSRGETPSAPFCGSGPYARLSFETIRHSPGRPVLRENGLISPHDCGKSIPPSIRFLSHAVPDLRLRKLR